jgi:hypothetical protein
VIRRGCNNKSRVVGTFLSWTLTKVVQTPAEGAHLQSVGKGQVLTPTQVEKEEKEEKKRGDHLSVISNLPSTTKVNLRVTDIHIVCCKREQAENRNQMCQQSCISNISKHCVNSLVRYLLC